MNPEPSAYTTLRRAVRKIRDLERSVQVPDASVVNAKHGKIFWLNIAGFRLVSDSESATFDIVETGSVELRERLAYTRVVGSISCVPTEIWCEKRKIV